MKHTLESAFGIFENRKADQYFNNPYNQYDHCSSFNMDGQKYYYDHVTLSSGFQELFVVIKPDSMGYLKTDGSTLKRYQEDHFKYHVVLRNRSGFIMRLTGFDIRYDDFFGDWHFFPSGGWDLTLEPGETQEINGNLKLNPDQRFIPEIRGDINGIAGIDVREANGKVTINAIAGVANYWEEDDWRREFEPYIRRTVFDFEEVMTPSDLARFGIMQGSQIRTNISHFLNGNADIMKCNANYNKKFD